MDYDNLLAGFIGSSLGVVVSHPFDTIKIYMQKDSISKMSQAIKIINKNGIGGFYNGIIPLILFRVPVKTIQYSIFGESRTYFKRYTNNCYLACALAGFMAGLFTSPFVSAMEYIKIMYQVNPNISPKTFLSKNVLKGLTVTTLRETSSGLAYYSSYYYSKHNLPIKNDYLRMFLSGIICGSLTWTVSFPLDVLKTKIQTDVPGYGGIKAGLKHLYQTGHIFRGYSAAILRASLVHGVSMLGYDATLTLLAK